MPSHKGHTWQSLLLVLSTPVVFLAQIAPLGCFVPFSVKDYGWRSMVEGSGTGAEEGPEETDVSYGLTFLDNF